MNAAEPAWLPPVLEAVPVAMIAFDSSGHVIGINEIAEELFIARGPEIAGKDASQPGGNLPARLRESVQKLLSGASEVERGEVQVEGKRLGYTVGWARGPEGERAALLSAQLLPSVDAAGADFLSMASHELKTPLTAIKGGAQLLQRRVARGGESKLAERDERLLGLVTEQVDKLADMVEGLLEASRLYSGRVQISKSSQQLDEVLADAVAIFQHRGPPNPVRLEVAAGQMRVECDRRRVQQALVALLENAAAFSPPEAPITLTLLPGEDEVCVSVADQGPGIPTEEQPHVFERFYKGSNTKGGLGLGLYVAAELIRLHGGHVGLESEPGQGSTFYFTLPRG
jgi:signal transduction histidine kinase